MTCSQCKDECDQWETCEGCRACKWLPVCNNAYRYLSDAGRGERMNKCARCGKDAPFFTDSYDPVKEENVTMYLCKDYQIEFTHKMAAFVRGDGEAAGTIKESEENSIRLKMKYDYTHHNLGGTSCLNCEFISCGGDKVCHCDLLGCRVYKGDICKGFKRRSWHINEGTSDEKIIERIKETMDNSKPMPIVTPPELHWDIAHMKDIAKVLEWLYIRGVNIHGTDEKIEEAIRSIGGEE